MGWADHMVEGRLTMLENDDVVRTMREFGFTGPITRKDYLEFIGVDPNKRDAEMESLLPSHLQDWSQFEKKK
jgi:hypothetical protein